MKLAAALAKPPLEAIRDSKSTQPAHAGTRGHLAEQRCRRLLAGVSLEVYADGESKNPKLPEIAHKPAQSANQVRHHTLASYDRLSPTEW